MHLKILGHPVFTALNFHMPMIVDLSHPLVAFDDELKNGFQNGSWAKTQLSVPAGAGNPVSVQPSEAAATGVPIVKTYGPPAE